ncbi:hypothetical protein BH09ACT12_BH09ACT12_09540 [soil metagenome]
MTTDEGTDLAPVLGDEANAAVPDDGEHTPDNGKHAAATGPSFWHRSHPVFTPLTGFFTGTLLVLLVVGILGIVLKALFDVDLSEHPGPFLIAILSLFVLNVVLLVAPGTRRFARYMLFGLLATPVVVGGIAALTLFVLVKNDS